MRKRNPSGGDSSLIVLGALAVGGYLLYTNWATLFPATATTTTAATQAAQPSAQASAPTQTPASATISIPSSLTVTPDINSALKGTITVNGQSMTIDVIPGNIGQSSGVVYNGGTDITSMFTAAQIEQIATAFGFAPLTINTSAGSTVTALSPEAVLAAALQSCSAEYPTNPAQLAVCMAQAQSAASASGLTGLARTSPNGIPAGLILGNRGFGHLPMGVFHRG